MAEAKPTPTSTTPPLQPNLVNPQEITIPLIPHVKNLPPSPDQLIEQSLARFSTSQLIQSILVSLSRFFDGQQTFITVYADAEPPPPVPPSPSSSWQYCDDLTIFNLSKFAWWTKYWDDISTTKLAHSSQTIITEWELECASSFIKGLPASSYFMGCVLGLLILGSLADFSLGRKKLLLLSCLLMSVASLATVFSTNIWVYSALKFVSGVGRASIGTCSLVLLTEKVGKRWRGTISVMGFLFFTIGYLSLPLIAYALKGSSWRSLYLWCSVPAVLYTLVLQFYVCESPRWLFLQGRDEEAVAVLRRIGSAVEDWRLIFKNNPSTMQSAQSKHANSFYSSIKMLSGRRWAVKRTVVVMVVGFGIGMVYYGMPLGMGNLEFNIYLGVALNALLELPSYAVTLLLLEKCNRKASVLGFSLGSGMLSVMCVFTTKKMRIWFEIGSLFSAVTAFNVVLAYAVELFPTCVRNCGMSMVSEALNLGAVLSPILDAAGRGNGMWSYGVFGIVIGMCGLFVNCLPETKGALLCDTMDQQEQHESRGSNIVIVDAI